MTQVHEARGASTGQQRPASSEGREQSRQAQSALSTGSPSKSGVVGTGKTDASVRVLLTGQRTGETAETEVKTKEQEAQFDNDSTQLQGAREDELELEFNDASRRAGSHGTCLHVT